MPEPVRKEFNHYYREVPTKGIDVYRILLTFGVTDPCIQHAVKKLLCMGRRGRATKTEAQDVHEAQASLERWHEMRAEEGGLTIMRGTQPGGPEENE